MSGDIMNAGLGRTGNISSSSGSCGDETTFAKTMNGMSQVADKLSNALKDAGLPEDEAQKVAQKVLQELAKAASSDNGSTDATAPGASNASGGEDPGAKLAETLEKVLKELGLSNKVDDTKLKDIVDSMNPEGGRNASSNDNAKGFSMTSMSMRMA